MINRRTRRCKDCLTTSWGCSWCSNENACLFNTSKCEKGAAGSDGPESLSSLTTLAPLITISSGSGMRSSLSLTGSVGSTTSLSSSSLFSASLQAASQPTSNTVSFIGQCPSFVVGSNQETLVADGTERGITMRVRNMPQIKVSLQQYLCTSDSSRWASEIHHEVARAHARLELATASSPS